VGAHVGFYTLVASSLVGQHGHVVAFEPLPENLYYLREHLSINRIDNVTIVDKAVTDHTGTVRFQKHENRSMGGISTDGDMSVAAVCLDELIENLDLRPPSCIKMDVEGGEYRALVGFRRFLSRCHPTIFLSTHGRKIHDDCCRLLQQYKYKLIPLDGMDLQRSTNILAIDDT
jgi:FkbM family methyltransferase